MAKKGLDARDDTVSSGVQNGLYGGNMSGAPEAGGSTAGRENRMFCCS